MIILDYANRFPFYRCRICSRVFTVLHELKMVKTGDVCPCGSTSYKPADVTWAELLLPRVWRLYWAYWTGKVRIQQAA